MAGKMSPKFVALCSLAVGAIYSTGYSITAHANTGATIPSQQSASSTPPSGATAVASQPTGNSGSSTPTTTANQSAGTQTQNTGTQNQSNGTQTQSKSQGSGKSQANSTATHSSTTTRKSTSTQSKPKKAVSKVNTTQQFLDGTYAGSATNAIGSVSVSVSIKSGKIADVQITACDTHYPEAYINPVLPNYVVAHQTIRIPIVSGATMSTADFYYAVVQALQKAQNPHYKGA